MIAKQSIEKQYNTKVLDHLGLVAGMCSELGIAKIIDEQIPVNSADKILSKLWDERSGDRFKLYVWH